MCRVTLAHIATQNMSQQSDSADLLGGFKPIELRLLCAPLKSQFERLFGKTFSKKVPSLSLSRSTPPFVLL